MKPVEARRLVFMGTPDFAVPSLEKLVANKEQVVAVFTQPDRPKGRGRSLAHSPVKETALRHNLPVVQPPTLRDPEVRENLSALRPDVLVVVAYGLLLPQAVLDVPTWGAINVHASLLPRYRGAAPIQWAVISGEEETGVTTMHLDAGLDTGDILLQHPTPIRPDDTSQTLQDRLKVLGGELLLETLQALRWGTLQPVKQDPDRATYAPPLKKDQGQLDWSLSAPELDRWIRGLSPWPKAFTSLRGKRLIIHRAEPVPSTASGEPGAIVSWDSTAIQVLTGQGILALSEVQMEGHRRLRSGDFVKGFPLQIGERLGR
ncbi:MAG: methionyl-tRNA formyltransferase [Deltaproteobacteria bacterium]|nr:methionyl-tRNA formyltransferase [Deltaproteobacteria bacterium]